MITDKELKLLQKLYLILGAEFTITDVFRCVEVYEEYEEYRHNHEVRHLATLFRHHPSCEVTYDVPVKYIFREYPC